MKKTTYIFTLIIAIILLQSCKQNGGYDCVIPDEYYNLTSDEKSKIPYPKGKDTLTFLSDAGDTAILYSSGQFAGYEIVPLTGRADCNIGSAYSEKIEVNYVGANSVLNNIKYNVFINEFHESRIQLQYGNTYTSVFPLYYVNDETKYKDSVIINGTMIYGVTLSGNIIFNKKYGVIKINNLTSKSWTLIY